MNPHHRWFAPIVWAGVLVNLGFGVAALVSPEWLVGLMCWPGALFPFSSDVVTGRCVPWSGESIWLRDAGGLLILLAVLYMPAAIKPLRYRANAIVFCIGRLLFSVFWIWPVLFAGAAWGFLILGVVDFALGFTASVAFARLTATVRTQAAAIAEAG